MRFFRTVFFVLLGGILLIGVIGLYLPFEFRVERAVFVRAPAEKVFDLAADLERVPFWPSSDPSDPTLRVVYGKKRSGKDATYFWMNERNDYAMVVFGDVVPGRAIRADLDLSSLGKATAFLNFEPRDSGVEVRETFYKNVGRTNLFERYFHPDYRERAGGPLEASLERLKEKAEAVPAPAPAAPVTP